MTLKVTGLDKVKQAVKDFRDSLRPGNYQEFLSKFCKPELERDFAICFKRPHRNWPALKPETIARKMAEGYPATPLVRTGLYRDTASALRVLKISRNKLTITNPLRYPVYLEDRFPVFGEVRRKWRGGRGGKLRRLYNKYHRKNVGG